MEAVDLIVTLLVTIGAVARVTRLITRDRFPFGPLRDWVLTKYGEPAAENEPDETEPVVPAPRELIEAAAVVAARRKRAAMRAAEPAVTAATRNRAHRAVARYQRRGA